MCNSGSPPRAYAQVGADVARSHFTNMDNESQEFIILSEVMQLIDGGDNTGDLITNPYYFSTS